MKEALEEASYNKTLNESLVANKIEKIYGILNGTTNYILTQMTEKRWILRGSKRSSRFRICRK